MGASLLALAKSIYQDLRIRKMTFQSVTRAAQKKKIRVLPIKVEPISFWLVVQMLFHLKLQETGGS